MQTRTHERFAKQLTGATRPHRTRGPQADGAIAGADLVPRTDEIAHDMRTPLAIILQLCDSLGDMGLPVEAADNVARVRANADRLAGRVDELVALQNGTSEPVSAPRPVDLAAVVQSVCDDLRVIASARQCRIRVRAIGPARVLGRETDLRSAVTNLVENAVRSAPIGGVVRCSVARCSSSVILEVADDGPGIPEREHANVLIPRYRGTAVGSGAAGLGLSIVRGVVAESNGRLSIHRAPEGGASIVVDLPALSRRR